MTHVHLAGLPGAMGNQWESALVRPPRSIRCLCYRTARENTEATPPQEENPLIAHGWFKSFHTLSLADSFDPQ